MSELDPRICWACYRGIGQRHTKACTYSRHVLEGPVLEKHTIGTLPGELPEREALRLAGLVSQNVLPAYKLPPSHLVELPGRRGGKILAIEQTVIQLMLQTGQPVLMLGVGGWYKLRMDDPCDEFDHERVRPTAPSGMENVWYRGWEVGFDHQAGYWGGTPWVAYKGGADLDAPCAYGETYAICLDEIDEQEDEA